MKLNFFGTIVILLVAFLPRYECRAVESPGGVLRIPAAQSPNSQQQQQQQQQHRSPSGPILERLGEEYFLRLGSGDSNSLPPSSMYPLGAGGLLNRALQLQLTRRLLQGRVGNMRAFVGGLADRKEDGSYDSRERGRRSEDPPISLDLTFHLLREMMEMSRAEQIAQQAQNNRRMMELFGK
ncbi:corticotropin releasing hormone b [Nerophis ophidion]|uniref:corticotropin releasing hormone b n=1 Tax=Nerophis ophidion TaxID=159077 RepID=UPI002ADFC1DD|nr:corticotropin releasing hormone b [Nerophis ophidion]